MGIELTLAASSRLSVLLLSLTSRNSSALQPSSLAFSWISFSAYPWSKASALVEADTSTASFSLSGAILLDSNALLSTLLNGSSKQAGVGHLYPVVQCFFAITCSGSTKKNVLIVQITLLPRPLAVENDPTWQDQGPSSESQLHFHSVLSC